MNGYFEKEILPQIADFLAKWLNIQRDEVHFYRYEKEIDGLIEIGTYKFAVEFKKISSSAQIIIAVQFFKKYLKEIQKDLVPLVAVPFMGEVGRKICKEENVSWIDLSGNADITAPGLRIMIDGKPNRFKSKGRPQNAFAPKSARIARWLLINSGKLFRQIDIAKETAMEEGFTSRIISRLETDGLVARRDDGLIRVPDPDLLLDAWRENYDFSKHHIIRGHIPVRSSDEILKTLSGLFSKNNIKYSATGLSAAWLYTKFTGFRVNTFYLEFKPSADFLSLIGFREESQGANTWLVIPKDEGVFHGTKERDGICCVHPVQVYMDLWGQPERAKEAAEQLRKEMLNWKSNQKKRPNQVRKLRFD